MPTATAPFAIKPRFRIRLGPSLELGPGKAELLEGIHRTGSITEAARGMKMSYMRAWKLVKSTDAGLSEPLVSKVRGGNDRGGARLTPTGIEVVRLYRELEAESDRATRDIQKRFKALLPR